MAIVTDVIRFLVGVFTLGVVGAIAYPVGYAIDRLLRKSIGRPMPFPLFFRPVIGLVVILWIAAICNIATTLGAAVITHWRII